MSMLIPDRPRRSPAHERPRILLTGEIGFRSSRAPNRQTMPPIRMIGTMWLSEISRLGLGAVPGKKPTEAAAEYREEHGETAEPGRDPLVDAAAAGVVGGPVVHRESPGRSVSQRRRSTRRVRRRAGRPGHRVRVFRGAAERRASPIPSIGSRWNRVRSRVARLHGTVEHRDVEDPVSWRARPSAARGGTLTVVSGSTKLRDEVACRSRAVSGWPSIVTRTGVESAHRITSTPPRAAEPDPAPCLRRSIERDPVTRRNRGRLRLFGVEARRRRDASSGWHGEAGFGQA